MASPELVVRRCSVESSFKSYAEFTGKHQCWSLFLIKLQTGGACSFIKKTPAQMLSCEICETFKNTYFEEHLWTTASTSQVQQRLLPANNTAEAVTEFSKIAIAEEEI